MPQPTLHRLRLPDGIELEYAEQGPPGAATTVLMLHGITDSWRSFGPVLPHLPDDWHVLALSQRGHGGSDKPASGYRTRDFAADAATFMHALGLPPALVVGHSMGATNAMRLALDTPTQVRAMVGAGAFASYSDKPALRDFMREAIEPLVDPVPRALADAFQRDTLAAPVPAGLVEAMVDESLRVPAHVWRAAFAALADDEVSAELHRIAVPTLLAWGDADAFVPAADTERLLREIDGARLDRFAGAGHALHWEQPERFAGMLVRFAGGLKPRTT